MGGFGSAIGDIAAKFGRTLAGSGADVPEMLRKSSIGRTLDDITGAKDSFFKMNGKAGEAIQKLHMDYQFQRSKYTKQLDTPLKEMNQALSDHPELSKHVAEKSTFLKGNQVKLQEIRADATRLNHAPAVNAANKLISINPENANRTLDQISMHHFNQARVLASADAFGSKMENVIPHIMDAYDSGDPLKKNWADGVMDLISNETHDIRTTTTVDGGKVNVSNAKSKIANAFRKSNKVRDLLGEKQLEIPNVDAKYSPPSELERKLGSGARVIQLPQVALKHLSTIMNLSSIHGTDLFHGLMGMTDANFKTFRDASSILAFTEHDILHAELNGRLGKVAKWSSSPTVGELFYKSYHMPFFTSLRRFQLTLTASVGYHSAQNWAYDAMKGSRRAVEELKEMGIDMADLQKTNGQLSAEQLTKAMFHFTNNRMFMDKSIERSMIGNKNGFWRAATMYHTFVNAQQRFIRRELGKMMRSGDLVGIAQFVGTIGIVWPALAPMLKSFSTLLRTANPQVAGQQMEQDYDSLTNPKDAWDFTSTYLDMLAHFGAMGVFTSYVAAAHGNRLANAVMGPVVGTGVRNAQDILDAVTQRSANGKHNTAPMMRDLLEDTIPIGGNIAAHQFFPTKKESPPTSRTRGSRPRRRR